MSNYFSLQYIILCESIKALISLQYAVYYKRYFYRSLKYIRGRAININRINTILERFLQVFICDNVYLIVHLFILDRRINHWKQNESTKQNIKRS